ncbi:hypothetical protein N7512_007723 [Penicillium capsulatum]|nr:hypothetical protein N7512_007723 [Penicillium capsulatum]
MLSFWPWRGEDNSPASFEKTLSTLSTRIAESTTRLDQQRQTARRFKALWTLYSTFAYLFYSIVLALVLGWESWGVKEYAAIAGGPVLIYAVRTTASRVFDYRTTRTQRSLDDLQKQRDETIEKLKTATKYNSTQQLLEKYGGESPKPIPSPQGEPKTRKPTTPSQPQPARTGLPPPPTANIRRPQPPSPGPSPPQTDEPEFAPNAFPAPTSGQYIEQPHWYDRLLDVLLGEDEMQPRNRMAMICDSCRLVNGQAPPGIKTPEELGRWRCGSCGAWNGEESETTKILSTLRQNTTESAWQPKAHEEVNTSHVGPESEENEQAQDDQEDEAQPTEQDQPVRRSKRGKGGKKP